MDRLLEQASGRMVRQRSGTCVRLVGGERDFVLEGVDLVCRLLLVDQDDVVPANNAAELQAALKQIYEGKILAEAVDYGETETIPPGTGR